MLPSSVRQNDKISSKQDVARVRSPVSEIEQTLNLELHAAQQRLPCFACRFGLDLLGRVQRGTVER